MAAESNYYGVWLVYSLSSLVFLVFIGALPLPSLACSQAQSSLLMIAVIFTPWYANSDGIRWRQRSW